MHGGSAIEIYLNLYIFEMRTDGACLLTGGGRGRSQAVPAEDVLPQAVYGGRHWNVTSASQSRIV